MSEITGLLAEQWALGIGPAIGAMTGRAAQAHALKREMPDPLPESSLVWRQELNAAPGALVWVWLPESVWLAVGRQVLQSAGLSDDGGEIDPAEARGTFLEVLQQSLAPIGPWLSSRLGREVEIGAGREENTRPDGLEWRSVLIRTDGGELGTGWLSGNAELLTAFPDVAPAPQVPAAFPATHDVPARPSRTLDLLMEVELPVGVSFGRAQMRLKDAIKLTTGSIVELNRSISEPVEIIVNNCVIARGEVVVVEGNYGVRIKQIISRDERLRTLF